MPLQFGPLPGVLLPLTLQPLDTGQSQRFSLSSTTNAFSRTGEIDDLSATALNVNAHHPISFPLQGDNRRSHGLGGCMDMWDGSQRRSGCHQRFKRRSGRGCRGGNNSRTEAAGPARQSLADVKRYKFFGGSHNRYD